MRPVRGGSAERGTAAERPAVEPAGMPSRSAEPERATAVGPPRRGTVWTVLGVALTAVSFAAIFIRWADAPGVVVAFYRMLIATVIMAPVTAAGLRRTPLDARAWRATTLAGALLAVHFAAWISSLSYTTVAASGALVSTSPLWVALFAWLFLARPPAARQLGGVLLSVAGAAIIGYGDMLGGSRPLLGDLLAVVGAAGAGGYLLLGRYVQARGVSLQAYAGSAYAVAAVCLAPLPWLTGAPYLGYPQATYLFVALLALVPQVIGHTGINYVAKYFDTTALATALLLEPLASGVLAYLLFGERPGTATLLGVAAVLCGMVLTVRFTPRAAA
ncbi:MAG: DMT family transporter [Trueperaceae bacterium]|nr:DMT family transporter [Trueperaceae bacterium]MCC6312051.1 DMT family transporter [Trueperaceae bacterium]MCO5174002.1 DMT family transporter [Trueperaceae bacterium]MCW5819186.1 DMT family transporter [Trueperaceae bacterium]